MENFDCYHIKNKDDCYLEQAYTHKYRIRDSCSDKYLVISNGNLDWVEKPKEQAMFKDIFDPVSLIEVIFKQDELEQPDEFKGTLKPISQNNQVLILNNGEWLLKKNKYVGSDKVWVSLLKKSIVNRDKANVANTSNAPKPSDSLDTSGRIKTQIKPIIEENPLHQIKLDWLGVACFLSKANTKEFVPLYVSEQIIDCEMVSIQSEPNLYFLYWVSMCYDSLPPNCLFLGSNNINIEEWPIHSPVQDGYSTMDRQVRVRDGVVLDAEYLVRDEFQRPGQCEFSVFVRQLLKISDSYLPFSSSHCYLIPRETIQRFPKIYYESLWWRISKHPNLYPDDYLSVLWGYLTTT